MSLSLRLGLRLGLGLSLRLALGLMLEQGLLVMATKATTTKHRHKPSRSPEHRAAAAQAACV